MKTIRNLKEVTILEVGDEVRFDNLVYTVRQSPTRKGYYLYLRDECTLNDAIFNYLKLNKRAFVESIGINACTDKDFPETKSLEALTAIVSALFKEYEKKDELPKTWEEFCMRNPIRDGECYIDRCSHIKVLYDDTGRDDILDKNVCTSKQEAEAFLALMQLRQLRKAYVKDWEPDWDNNHVKYCIICDANQPAIINCYHISGPLSFPTEVLANQFLNNFKDLLEIAKPLL